eukprot:10449840-Ditylum_brightwellii.AAC.1
MATAVEALGRGDGSGVQRTNGEGREEIRINAGTGVARSTGKEVELGEAPSLCTSGARKDPGGTKGEEHPSPD